jgi:hypothetical protein
MGIFSEASSGKTVSETPASDEPVSEKALSTQRSKL